MLNGLDVIVINHMFEKSTNIPRRRSKKKRIQKKLIKKYGYIKKIDTRCIIFEDKMFCHLKTLDKIKNEIK